jgi:XTP/dITP diphosphohydrolase
LAQKLSEKLVIASHNEGKVREIGELLEPLGIAVTSAAALGLPEPEETGQSFAENAALKARAAAERAQLPALADDSGLSVAALGGAPGIHSARWAEDGEGRRDFGRAMEKVQESLADSEDRSAAFVCALAMAQPDSSCEIFEGRVEGQIVWPPRGSHGFGYDPIFLPDGYNLTFGEMEPSEKHAISHRARAFAKLMAAIPMTDGFGRGE